MAIVEVWSKSNLPVGDVQLLENSHASGVLRLTQADYGIDQTTYFRDQIFAELAWYPIDGKEMANASFRIITENIDHGIFNLAISHKPSWESQQNNYTTGLHWGDALGIVQNIALVGKKLSLYKVTDDTYDFLIKID
jgi:hypothetical protein